MENMNKKHKRRRRLVVKPRFYLMLAIVLIALLLVVLTIIVIANMPKEGERSFSSLFQKATPTPTATPVPTASPVPAPTATPMPTPHSIGVTLPESFGIVPHIEVDGQDIIPESYSRYERISFVRASEYNKLNGVLTFRGDNERNSASFGTASLTEYKLTQVWSKSIGSLKKNSGTSSWTGSGWTGQPLLVQWDDETRQIMNMYDWAKAKTGLVEVIYATMDGNVYFLDLDTGEPTRDMLVIGSPFKGTGTIDPRGFPLLYLGSGDEYDDANMKSRAMVYSLIDCTCLYTFGVQDSDSFAKRVFYAYDSAPVVDAGTDTLIYPAENGVIYTMKLNTSYDMKQGRITINPSNIVKFRYDSNRSSEGIGDTDKYWLGYEGSAVTWNSYLYLPANDGLFQCIDLNTMSIVWVCDTLDDTNGTPVLEVVSDTEAYLYVGTSLHFTKDANNTGRAPFFKINAMTGEIVHEYGLTVHTMSGVSGGIQSSAALGKNNLEGLVFVTIARVPDMNNGVLVALNKDTFEVVWQFDMENYSWSSPLVIYTDKGDGYIVQADSVGNLFLLDGKDGTTLYDVNLTASNFEASPSAFGNMLVLGCRGQMIFGVRIS